VTTRRAFFASLAAAAAPLFARLALPAAPERKLLGNLRIPHAGVCAEHKAGHLYVRSFNSDMEERWLDLGLVVHCRLDIRPTRLRFRDPCRAV
jgi:hypothetical protein